MGFLLREQAHFFPPSPNPLLCISDQLRSFLAGCLLIPEEGAFLQGAAPPAPAKLIKWGRIILKMISVEILKKFKGCFM